MAIWSAVITAASTIASDWFEQRRETKQLKHKRRLTQLEAKIDWEAQAQKNAQTSWKDEYWTIVVSIPLIGAFIPPMLPYITAGFSALSTMPEWYMAAVGMSIAASFGNRTFKTIKENTNAK